MYTVTVWNWIHIHYMHLANPIWIIPLHSGVRLYFGHDLHGFSLFSKVFPHLLYHFRTPHPWSKNHVQLAELKSYNQSKKNVCVCRRGRGLGTSILNLQYTISIWLLSLNPFILNSYRNDLICILGWLTINIVHRNTGPNFSFQKNLPWKFVTFIYGSHIFRKIITEWPSKASQCNFLRWGISMKYIHCMISV